MDFRKAVKSDISQLIEMRLAYLKEDYGFLSEEQIIKIKNSLPVYYRNHLEKDLMIYVAEESSEIIATVFLLVIEKPANPSFITGKTGAVLNVYTKSQYRRQGIGRKLMNMMLNDADKMNLSYVELQATDMGKGLYEKIGFNIEKSEYTPMKYKIR